MTTTFDYTTAKATAERLIAKFGQSGVIRRAAVAGGNAWDPSSGVTTTTDYACTLVVTDYSNNDVNGTLILQTDRRVFISTASLSVVPTVTDSIVFGSTTLRVINVKPLSPAGTVLLYEVQCRV